MNGTYTQLLRHAGVMRILLISLICKLGGPVLSFVLLLAAVDRLGSYGTAGLVLAGHGFTLAVCAPIAGRLADRVGPRRSLVWYLPAYAAAFALLLLALRTSTSVVVLIGAAVLLGATSPSTASIIRGILSRLVPDGLLTTAYAIDSAINNIVYVLGPMLGAVLMLVMPASAVVAVAGGAALTGGVLLRMSRAVREAPRPVRPEPGTSRGARLVGPLTDRATLVLLSSSALGAFTYGCLRIATTASATAFGSASSAGLLMGLLSAGELVGALIYGARVWRVSSRRLLVLLILVDALSMLAGAFAASFIALAVLITATGVLSGPRDTLQSTLLGEATPARYRTEVFAWLTTFMWAGYSLGVAVAGSLTGPTDNGTAAFICGVAASALGAVLVAACYHPAPKDAAEAVRAGG